MSEVKSQDQLKEETRIKHVNIYAALAAFQGELKPMEKKGEVEFATSNGKTVKFKYTPLGDIMAVIYPLLAKHGLSVRHEITEKGIEAILTHETYYTSSTVALKSDKTNVDEVGKTLTETNYVHVTGNEIRSGAVKIAYGNQMKDTGAAITYARRYTLTMVLGISSEDDKDAELLEQSAKNAVHTVYSRFKAGLEKAKTPAEIDKSTAVIQKDLKSLEAGKAPSLGLSAEQYQELLDSAEEKKLELTK